MSDVQHESLFSNLDMQGADMQPLSPIHFIHRVAYVFAEKNSDFIW
jgi:hypothetical protein